MWQRVWDERDRGFRLVGVAQEAAGAEQLRRVLAERPVEFEIAVDESGLVARALELRVVPAGVFVDPDGRVAYLHRDDFDIRDPRVRVDLERFLAGEPLEPPRPAEPLSAEACELFARGAELERTGERAQALTLWRAALALEPDSFLIRSQIWVAEHPERFYPAVDRDWQAAELVRQGYDGPLP